MEIMKYSLQKFPLDYNNYGNVDRKNYQITFEIWLSLADNTYSL